MSIGMSDELTSFDQRAVIKVCGVGGGGGNAVTRMLEEGLQDVEFIAINTDAQALKKSPAPARLQLGASVTGGLGSGAKPEIGRQSAMDDRDRIHEMLIGADMVFVTAGLGGGTGTGAAPIVADVARSSGALTVGIVTLPFTFEGNERMDNAFQGLEEMEKQVDTLIVVPNDRVERLCQENVSLLHAFKQADEVLHNGVRAISELITIPGLINLDFADVRTIMQSRGRALMGIGIAEGDGRAARAAEEAIVCPLLEQSNIHGAMGVIANIKGGCEITMREVQEAVSTVQQAAHPDANIIFGAVVDDEPRDDIQVTVIAAGFPKGVSSTFLDGRQNMKSDFVEISSDVAASVSRSGQDSELAPPKPVAASAVAEQPPAPEAVPEVAYLFPEDAPSEAKKAVPKSESDEDLSIPAFMRRRKRL
jgi:cell division protein FtsZ